MRNYKIIVIIILMIAVALTLFVLRMPNQESQEHFPKPIIKFEPSPILTPSPQITDPKQKFGGVTEEYKKEQRKFVEQTPILQKLPVKSTYFSIEYIDEEHLVVVAKTSNKSRDYQIAKNWFIENNINFDKINIEYK